MALVVLGAEIVAFKARRPAPERKRPARDAPVERGGDLETVVVVVLAIVDQAGNLVPCRAPRDARKAEPPGEAGRIAEGEIEPGDHPFALHHRVREHFREQ